MEVTIDTVLRNKQNYNEYIKKVIQDRKKLMKKVTELKRNKENMSDELDIAKADFEESKLVQEINDLTYNFKAYKLTLEQLELQQDILEYRIDKETYAKKIAVNRQEKLDISDEQELTYCENEVEKCKNALKLYTLENDVENISKWKQALNKATEQLKDAQENVKQEDQEKTMQQEKKTETKVEKEDRTVKENQATANEVEENSDTEGLHGYSFEQNGNIFTERMQQVLKDHSGNELGSRVITDTENLENGERTVETIGGLENEDGKYSIKETSKVIGTELEYQRKEMNVNNRITGETELYAYQKDNKGNELYYRTVNGKTTFRIIKGERGTTIENYDDNGSLSDIFEYDADGKALIAMGDIQEIDENYVQDFFDGQVPYYEAENRDLGMQNKEQSVLDSAVEATEDIRTGTINEQAQIIKNRQQARMHTHIQNMKKGEMDTDR